MHKNLNLILVLFLLTVTELFGQWVANPERAKRLIVDNYAPYDITTLENPGMGAFIVWMDKKETNETVLLYQSIDNNGRVRMQADGKRVTELNGMKENPIAQFSPDGTVQVLWKETPANKPSTLYLQRIRQSGNKLYGENGIPVTSLTVPTIKYSMGIDAYCNTWICLIEKKDSIPATAGVKVFKISNEGVNETPDSGISVYTSRTAKYEPGIFVDKNNVVYTFWLEAKQGKNALMMHTVNDATTLADTIVPQQISSAADNVLSYRLEAVRNGRLLLVWQTSGKNKEVNYQLLDAGNKKVLTEPLKICSKLKGSKISFQMQQTPDSAGLVSWIQESAGKKFLFFKKITSDGKSEWGDTARSVSKQPVSILGYSVCIDKQGGIYAAWLDRNDKTKHLDIMAQKISKTGAMEWGANGFQMLNSTEQDKSYLTLVNYSKQSVAAIYREKNKMETVICGQRLYAEQKAISAFADVNAQVEEDSIVVNWRMANESQVTSYHIEKFLLKTNRDTSWSSVAVVPAKPFSSNNDYRYAFIPDSDGVFFIRIVQYNKQEVISTSENLKISYLKDYGDNIVLLQNNPNPFSDSTSIMYYLPYPMTVHFEIYNSRIERIDEVYVRDTQKGRNRFEFNGRHLSPGVYFYRFTAGGVVEVKKMVVSR